MKNLAETNVKGWNTPRAYLANTGTEAPHSAATVANKIALLVLIINILVDR